MCVVNSISGGRASDHAGAVRLSIARTLLKYDPDLRPKLAKLKERSFLTRDSRVVERKKVGLRKARKAKQFSKR